ncbi:MAG: hypothetical protein ABT15_24810 [Pseudonocardia sp. SCN 73-27]|nr:MAG: hypothetical protein ABS80_07385 [Pseudonocardia sp. SCN 72-51]ODV02705.1 MAG: hypothetical protein ABT15_24810 [Pseudonocardia sp. SCN 73-27]
MLTDRTRQLRRLASLGVSEVVVVPFDAAWARVPAAEFVDRVLVDRLSAEHVCVGANFRFGAQGAGSPQTLAADGRFGTSVVPLLVDAGEPVSSSRIRVLIDSGDVEQAAGLLGAPHIQPATRDGDGRLHFAPELAVPRSGDFEVLIDGTPGRWRPAQPPGAGAAGPGAETVEVTFLRPVGASW